MARQLFNAADHGAPQRRERVFIVGFRADQDVHWNFPDATHSQDELLYSQWVSGEYWDRHKVSKKARGLVPDRLKAKVAALRGRNFTDGRLPWITIRDALKGCPNRGPMVGKRRASKIIAYSLARGPMWAIPAPQSTGLPKH